MIGDDIHNFARILLPFNRSLTGIGVRETLEAIRNEIPELEIFSVPSGTQAFDWEVPLEWQVNEAYVLDPLGNRILDYKTNNLHLVGYSAPFLGVVGLQELQEHLYSLPDQPTAIPYVTSYYQDRWGLCISNAEREKLIEGKYRVVIDTIKFAGNLNYGEIVIPGAIDKEIFLSTYICHPSMANNELSGPSVLTFIAKWLQDLPVRKYTYRIIFIPETIGSLVYLSKNLIHLKENVYAGFNLTCIGDDRAYSFLPSRNGNTVSDKIAQHVLKNLDRDFVIYKWEDRGSDERQYCAPGIDLPIASIMRTKYAQFPEYHTSLDNLENVVTPSGLFGGFNAVMRCLEALEKDCNPLIETLGEPQLGKRGLYPTLSTKTSGDSVRTLMNLITWSDGNTSLIDIANKLDVPVWDLYPYIDKLEDFNLLKDQRDQH